MEIIDRSKIGFIDDTCGKIQEVYQSPDLSVAYAIITGEARSHRHEVMRERYSFVNGTGTLYVGEESFRVGPGMFADIPLGVYHHLESDSAEEPLELWVITTPGWDPKDVIEEFPE